MKDSLVIVYFKTIPLSPSFPFWYSFFSFLFCFLDSVLAINFLLSIHIIHSFWILLSETKVDLALNASQ